MLVTCSDLPPDLPRAVVALQREAVLHRATIVLCGLDAIADERVRTLDAAFVGYPGPLAATASRRFSGGAFAHRGVTLIDLPPLNEAERATLWRRHLEDVDAVVAADAAARYQLTGGQIERAARACAARSPGLAEIHAGVSAVLDDRLATLGTRIEWRQQWSDLVLPEQSHDELVEMVARVRYKKHVLDDWGFGDKVAKGLGLAALFSGPPGTGKTMAAGLVAQELGLDLYQIDLSRMVSKYVGETEKHLAQVFDAAESGHAILLFDEADALFSKRTEVKSSVDRYANLEVNYLLQRMEAFSGITILTTNFDNAIDEAFRRRLSFRIAFALPERAERQRLWRAIIPARALGAGIDWAELADRFEMSGGYIKNAALRAAYLAAADGTVIEMHHLLRAAGAEYASMGKVVSERGSRGL
jgi:predicted nucleic acid-binding protein